MALVQKEMFAAIGHAAQQGRNLESPAKPVPEFVAFGDEPCETDGLDIADDAAIGRRESPTQDRAHIGVDRIFDNALFDRPHCLQRLWMEQPAFDNATLQLLPHWRKTLCQHSKTGFTSQTTKIAYLPHRNMG